MNKITAVLNIKESNIRILRVKNEDYISLTDLASYFNPNTASDIIRNWMSNRNSFEFYSLWEELNNPVFNYAQLHVIKNSEIGFNRFTMTPTRWKKEFNGVGIIPSSGKYSIGTFAHSDIALEFASWLDPKFKLYLIKEFQRLKSSESYQNKIEWSVRRSLTKTNYRVHTDSIKENIIPVISEKQKKFIYQEEADLLNVALFGMTAKQWQLLNPNKKGNMRDYADIIQLIILSNLEVINADMIEQNLNQKHRIGRLNQIAIKQYNILKNDNNIEKINNIENNHIKKEKSIE